jgi:hypothetical protein
MVVAGWLLAAVVVIGLSSALALVIATSLISLLTHAMDVASVSTDLAALNWPSSGCRPCCRRTGRSAPRCCVP